MQSNETAVMLIELIVAAIGLLVGRYVLPKYKSNIQNAVDQFQLLFGYAESFCAYAKQFLSCSGSEKMDNVVEKLGAICEKEGIDIDQETLRAIGQKAYNAMVIGEAQASNTSTLVVQPTTLDDVKIYEPKQSTTTDEEVLEE